MKIMKKLAALAMTAAMVAGLAACGGGVTKADATVYIQGEMDSTYLGQYNEDYLKLMEMTEDEAREQNYEWNLNAQADLFMEAYGLEDIGTIKDDVVELFKEIYSHSKYTVQPANKLENGNFAVEVLVEPIDIVNQFDAMYVLDELILESMVEAGVDMESSEELTDEEYDAAMTVYAGKIIKGFQDLIPGIGYEPQQSCIIQLKLNGDVYEMVGTDWQNMDYMVVDMYGDYAG